MLRAENVLKPVRLTRYNSAKESVQKHLFPSKREESFPVIQSGGRTNGTPITVLTEKLLSIPAQVPVKQNVRLISAFRVISSWLLWENTKTPWNSSSMKTRSRQYADVSAREHVNPRAPEAMLMIPLLSMKSRNSLRSRI